MKIGPALPEYANDMDTDFSGTVVAASILQYYGEAHCVYIKRLGNRGRAQKKDIARIKEDHLGITPGDIVVEVNRESIYDYMPEGVFHRPTLGGIQSGTASVIEAIREQRRNEADNRLFFSPFEQEASLQEIRALLHEQCIDNKGMYHNLLQLLYPLWPLLEQLDSATAKIFIYLLPFFCLTSGNKKWLTKMLQSLLGYPVSITETPHLMKIDKQNLPIDLLNKKLGISTQLCGNHIDGSTNWQLTIGPMAAEDAKAFLPGSKLNRLLQAIYENFSPEDTIIEQQISIQHSSFRLGAKTGSPMGHLGYTTFL